MLQLRRYSIKFAGHQFYITFSRVDGTIDVYACILPILLCGYRDGQGPVQSNLDNMGHMSKIQTDYTQTNDQ